MPRSFDVRNIALPNAGSFKDPQLWVRTGSASPCRRQPLAAASSPSTWSACPRRLLEPVELSIARAQLGASQVRLKRSRLLTANIDKGKAESESFLATYFTNRRYTYSTIINEINQAAKTAGMNMKEATFASLDPIEGTDDLEMLTVSVNFEGGYPQLVKLVNLMDRSPRFLIIESLQIASPPKGDTYDVTIKLNAFVRDMPGGAL